MTGRDRILSALRRDKTDFIPWTPCVDGYYLSGLQSSANQVDAVRDFGGDVFARHISVYKEALSHTESSAEASAEAETILGNRGSKTMRTISKRENIETRIEIRDAQVLQTTTTPLGELRCRRLYNEHATYIPFPMERRVKTVGDLFGPCTGVFLGSGDAVPQGTPFENLQAVTDTVRKA